ncbi:MAG: DnaA/Hda family protein [Alphaproteobacteria bacterium]|nr:DnaA/Hda family protein [Alphaproteobacteria bacterium]
MSSIGRQYPLPLPHSESLAAEDFMITDSNREAAAWIDRWPEWPSRCLIIYGPSGSGKTHLAEVWKQHSGAKSVTLDQISSIANETANAIIDNADKIAKNKIAEEQLFHAFNRLREKQGSMLLTSTDAPARWGIELPDLRSRLVAAPAIAIHAPDDTLLAAMLIKQFRDRQLNVESGVIEFIIPRIERSPAAIRQLVETLDKTSLANNRGITISLARSVLA